MTASRVQTASTNLSKNGIYHKLAMPRIETRGPKIKRKVNKEIKPRSALQWRLITTASQITSVSIVYSSFYSGAD